VSERPVLVAVDGIDGSGKSRFADALARECTADGLSVAVVRVDDFRRPQALEDVGAEQEAEAYYERYYDFAAVDAHLDALVAAGRTSVIILEGVFVLRVRRAVGACLVVLEVAAEVAFERLRARDAARGRPPEEVDRRIRRRYLPGQARYRAELDPAGRADLLIDNGDWSRPAVLLRRAARLPAALEPAVNRVLSRNSPGDSLA
jgi:uridine kinase